jgi:hypothetical protein
MDKTSQASSWAIRLGLLAHLHVSLHARQVAPPQVGSNGSSDLRLICAKSTKINSLLACFKSSQVKTQVRTVSTDAWSCCKLQAREVVCVVLNSTQGSSSLQPCPRPGRNTVFMHHRAQRACETAASGAGTRERTTLDWWTEKQKAERQSCSELGLGVTASQHDSSRTKTLLSFSIIASR